MSAIAAAIGFAAVASIAAGQVQASAAKSAAKKNAAVQREALALQREQAATSRQDQLAQIEVGQRATRTLAGTATEGGEALGGAEGPGLDRTFESERSDFLVSEAERAINRRLAASGQAFSGAALETIGKQTTDIRTGESQREIDLLFNLAQLGTGAAGNVGQTNAALTNQSSQSLASIGSGNAQGKADAGTAIASGLTGAGNAGLTGVALSKIGSTNNNGVQILQPGTPSSPGLSLAPGGLNIPIA